MSRVYEIAKTLGVDSKAIIKKLGEVGIEVKSHMSALDEATVNTIHQIYAPKKESSHAKEEHKAVIKKKEPHAHVVSTKKEEEHATHITEEAKHKEKEDKKKKKEHEEINHKVEVKKPHEPHKEHKEKEIHKEVVKEKVKEVEVIKEEIQQPVHKEVVEVIETKPEEKEVVQELPKEEPLKEVEKKIIKVHSDGIVVSELAKKMDVQATDLIKKMIGHGIFAAINQRLDLDTAILVASEYNHEIEHVPLYGEDILTLDETKEDPAKLKPRFPVVTIMGHVDHGKTKLLDAIRETNVIDKEAGGITQHIGAYLVKLNKGSIVFLDTPGHAAFTAMRARGAHVTDIVILVVAADEGVMLQTIEAMDHAKSAQVPIIVAVNKIDKPGANPDKIKQQLADRGLLPEDWGGQTIYVEVSAKQKLGLEHLLEMILLQAEMMELKANPDKSATGVILESKLDKGRGPVATVLVQEGTLKVGDAFVTGVFNGKIRAMYNDLGKKVDIAGPSTPVEILGCSGVPQAGDLFQVAQDEKTARLISAKRQHLQREKSWGAKQNITLEDLYKKIEKGVIKELNIIVKADVQGSVEAITGALTQVETTKINIRVIHGAPGSINETDIMLASASNAIIVGFNVKVEPKAQDLAEKEKVEIKIYSIIYEIINNVKAAAEGLLAPEVREIYTGKAEVREVFKISKIGNIAGSIVLDGEIVRSAVVKVKRDGKEVFKGKLFSLKRFKDDVKSVQVNFECGIGIDNFEPLAGDIVEAYKIEEVAQKL